MKKLRQTTCVLVSTLLLALLQGCSSGEDSPSGEQPPSAGKTVVDAGTAITGVNVVPMTSAEVLEGYTVVIHDGAIRHMAPAGELALGDAVKVIDGSGKYLMPGLTDMHKHIDSPESLKLDVAYGVTTVRNMWGTPETLAMAAAIKKGEQLGPEVINGSPLIDGDPPYFPGSRLLSDAAEAEALVVEMKEKGYAFLKPYELLKEDVYFALVEAAGKHGMSVEGHIPQSVNAFDAIEAGHDTVEHSMRFDSAIVAPGIPWDTSFRPRELVDVVARVDAGELTYEKAFRRDKLRELSRLVIEKGAAIVPTLGVIEILSYSDDDRAEMRVLPNLKYVSPEYTKYWLEVVESAETERPEDAMDKLTDAEIDSLEEFATREYGEWVGIMHEEGVLLMAGVDAPNPGMFHGYSLHEELQHFVNRAGLSNYEALKTATVNPAIWWGEQGTRGIVAEGADADLVLLSANPLEDIANTLQIAGVVLGGAWLSRAELEGLREEVAAAYREMEAAGAGEGEQDTGLPVHLHRH